MCKESSNGNLAAKAWLNKRKAAAALTSEVQHYESAEPVLGEPSVGHLGAKGWLETRGASLVSEAVYDVDPGRDIERGSWNDSSAGISSKRRRFKGLLPPPEDSPIVAVHRETFRKESLACFATANNRFGPMSGHSKTARSCQQDGMVVGLAGMFGRFLWVQHMLQTIANSKRTTCVEMDPNKFPDPVFPSSVRPQPKLIAELVEGGRGCHEAEAVFTALADSCKSAASTLESMTEGGRQSMEEQVVTLLEEVRNARGECPCYVCLSISLSVSIMWITRSVLRCGGW
ncbi:unnamed protein product [Choristocarpus tenellus]